jgi:hypothetical protein
MKSTTSSDGTQIAYDRTGEGPALILVTGKGMPVLRDRRSNR